MSESQNSLLRLYDDSDTQTQIHTAQTEPLAWLSDICGNFEQATGWSLRYVSGQEARVLPDPLWSAPVDPGVGTSPGYLMIGSGRPAATSKSKRIGVQAAKDLAGSLVQLVNRLGRLHKALRRSEAELATGVPVVARAGDTTDLAERLEAVLRGGAEAIGCQAAGLYLLDAATTELKLRSCWGLPTERLTEPARTIQGAVADLEALSGNAVVLEDDQVIGAWHVPEPCRAAVCVPVSTTSSILGTLWMFADRARPFDEKQTNLIEIIAGRLAANLEREALLAEGASSVGLRREIDSATRLQQSQLPQVAPLVEGWDVAGRTHNSDGLSGDFHDWFTLADRRLAIAVGSAHEQGTAAALTAQTLRTALRVHAAHENSPAALLAQANETMWNASAGDQFAAALVAAIEPHSGKLTWASAGHIGAVLVGPDRYESLSRPGVPLGVQSDLHYRQHATVLAAGEMIVLYSDQAADVGDPTGADLAERLRAEKLLAEADAPAGRVAGQVRRLLEDTAVDSAGVRRGAGHTVLVVRRTNH